MTKNLTLAGKPIAELVSAAANSGHGHGLNTVAGYILRQTQRDGQWLWHAEGSGCGEDVAVFEGSASYGALLDRKRELGHGDDQYFVADFVYTCGCRSGLS